VRGCGGFGAVYRATDLQTGQIVAIKENQRHQTFQRFEREGKLLMQLSHPNLPKVHEVFVDQTTGRAFLVMDFIDGETLEEMLERLKRPLNWQEAQPILAQVINALNHLHRNKVVHRDIKPSNIIVTKRNEKVHVFLVDFGVAKVMEEVDPKRPRSSSIVAWTDGYSPPEQYASGVQVDARADQYALAATMVFALTGKTPDDAFTRMEKFRKGEPTLPPKPDGVPESVWKAIEVAMRFEPNYRFADVDEFWEAIHGRGKLPVEPSKAETKPSEHWDTIASAIGVAWIGVIIFGAIWGAIWGAKEDAFWGAIAGVILGAYLWAILGGVILGTILAVVERIIKSKR
jgi:serine/threonine-protein kinase